MAAKRIRSPQPINRAGERDRNSRLNAGEFFDCCDKPTRTGGIVCWKVEEAVTKKSKWRYRRRPTSPHQQRRLAADQARERTQPVKHALAGQWGEFIRQP